MIEIFIKKGYNESSNVDQSIERQLKVLAYVRQIDDERIDRRMQDVTEQYKGLSIFLGGAAKR